ncbi:DnaA ATPase domain-containing protein [Propionivibrio sp.]|uniref:DnaA ATPase domain-containing protein n=1 Tax=Propionivibrio sp. TaxID=2212460 RepID=UPI003BEFDEF3
MLEKNKGKYVERNHPFDETHRDQNIDQDIFAMARHSMSRAVILGDIPSTTHTVVSARKLRCENFFLFDQGMILHLYLGLGFDCPADGVYAHSPLGGIKLLKTGVVTEVTFGSEWGLLDHENLVASYISKAVKATLIPMIEWTSLDELAESNKQFQQIMSSLNDFCKARAEPEPITAEHLNKVIACGIDPKLNFDRFNSNSNNALAYTYAFLASTSFGRVEQNPLLILGPVGSGKKHLLHAVGNSWLHFRPEGQVVIITADELSIGLSDKVCLDRLYSMELVLLEDIHLLKHQPVAQMALLQLGEYLKSRGVQIVITITESESEHSLGFIEPLAELLNSGTQVMLRI